MMLPDYKEQLVASFLGVQESNIIQYSIYIKFTT